MEVNNNIYKAEPKKATATRLNKSVLYTLPVIFAGLCYYNSLNGEFVHDDIFAIKNNPDVNGKSPLSAIWKNDFWGKSIFDETSHKSYRPITTISFRINYELSGGNPFTFHVLNVLLHCIVTGLFVYTLHEVFQVTGECSLFSSLLFAVHPIHTEAVSGIVGRADILAAIFFLLTIIFYVRCLNINDDEFSRTINCSYLGASVICAVISTLCKEHGVMVLVVTAAVDCLIICRKGVNRILSGNLPLSESEPLIKRIILLAILFCLVSGIRFLINGGQVPTFLEQDNPASFSSNLLTRILTFNYLLAFNSWLLLAPTTLCYDWQIGSIPLVESFSDPRNLATVVFYIFLYSIIRKCYAVFKSQYSIPSAPVLAVVFMILPFIPATNLFIRVGFVVAERILYISSLGFCLMVGYGLSCLSSKCPNKKWLLMTTFILYASLLAIKTVHRNQVWQSRKTLFWSGVVTLPHNAKVHYNYGNYLKDMENIPEAIQHYKQALRLYPTHASVHNNLGTILTNQSEAEYHFKEALRYNPGHKGALVNLANGYHNENNHAQAESLINQVLKLDPSYHLALMSLSKIMMETNRNEEAKQYIEKALKTDPRSPDAHNYHGAYLHRTGKYTEAVKSYLTAYSLDSRVLSSVTNEASILRTIGRATDAEHLLKGALSVNPKVELKNQLGLLYYSTEHITESLEVYENILKKAPNYTEGAANYAKILIALDKVDAASNIIENVLIHSPNNVEALQIMANVYLKKGDQRKAIEYLEAALQQASHNMNGDNLLATLSFHLGNLYRDLKDLTTAITYFENTIKYDIKYAKAYLHIGGIHHINNNYTEARKYYDEALRLEPNNNITRSNIVKLDRLENRAKNRK